MPKFKNEVLASGRIGNIYRGDEENRPSFTLTIVGKQRVDRVRFACPDGIPSDISNGMKVYVEGYVRSFRRADDKSGQGFVASKISRKYSEMKNAYGDDVEKAAKGYYHLPDYFVAHLSGTIAGKIDSGVRFGKIILRTQNIRRNDQTTTVILGYYKESKHRPAFESLKTGDVMCTVCSVYTPESKNQESNIRLFEDLSVEDAYIEPTDKE